VRLEEDQLPQKIFAGHSNCRTFVGAGRFTLSQHFDSDGDYILTSVKCTVSQSPDYLSNQPNGSAYRNEFTCVPFAVPVRPLRVTPKPLISGPQTAVVSVKEGEESWIDKFGRVRVQFPWDREGKDNETSACWVRVAQAWAGSGWGVHFWPRTGQEVVVEFLEGDPDRPMISGSVYNSRNMPPYKLPENHTRSGIQSRSLKEGTSKNFNELRFEDKKGQEQIFLNAEKDMDHRVENDHRIFVGAAQHLSVAGLQNVSIGSDHSAEFGANRMEEVAAKFSLHVGDSHHETVKNVYTLKAGDEIHLHSDVKIVIEGKSRVSIKGPGGFIDIGDSGVTIVGKEVNVNSGGSAESGSEAKPDAPQKPHIADDGTKGTKMA